jgi:hypothetical protein
MPLSHWRPLVLMNFIQRPLSAVQLGLVHDSVPINSTQAKREGGRSCQLLCTHLSDFVEAPTGRRASGIRPGSGLREDYADYKGRGTGRLRGERRAVQRADYDEWPEPNPPDYSEILSQICYLFSGLLIFCGGSGAVDAADEHAAALLPLRRYHIHDR